MTKVRETKPAKDVAPESVPMVVLLKLKISRATSGRFVYNIFELALSANVPAERISSEAM